MSNAWIKEDVRIEGPNLSKQGDNNYLSPVEACLETLMTYGTDRYGAIHAPILVSILDIESKECPVSPLPLDQQWRVQRPMRRNLAGANMLMDMSTLKTMYHLSEITGITKSANFAQTYMDYYMMHLVDEKGLFWWGWHRHYDVYKDQMTGHGGNVHELHAMHCIDWFRLWEINPPAVQREIEAIWEWHVIDKETGETDRHDSQQPGCDFSMSAGAHLYAFAFLSHQLQDSKWLDRAKLLANYYWRRRNPATDLFPDRPNAGADRFDGEHFVTACVGLHGHALLKSYQLTGDPLFRDYAIAYLTAYANYGYDPKAEKFWGSLRLDGTAETDKRFLDGYEANEPRGHLDMWAPYVCGYQYPIYTAQVYAFAYHLTKNQLFLTTAEHFANLIEREPPTSGCLKESWYEEYATEYASHGTHADKYGRVISFFLHLFVLTKERRYLDSAQQTADEAIDKLFANGLLRGHPAKPYYEATDNVGALLYGLLELDLVLRDTDTVLNHQEILTDSEGRQLPLDNW